MAALRKDIMIADAFIVTERAKRKKRAIIKM